MFVKRYLYLVISAIFVVVGTNDRSIAEGAMADALPLLIQHEHLRFGSGNMSLCSECVVRFGGSRRALEIIGKRGCLRI